MSLSKLQGAKISVSFSLEMLRQRKLILYCSAQLSLPRPLGPWRLSDKLPGKEDHQKAGIFLSHNFLDNLFTIVFLSTALSFVGLAKLVITSFQIANIVDFQETCGLSS